tara:strand:+ start:146 stop:1192 length:1047 start_codon:yes stop_codon:yes gene_type:complete
LSLQNGSFISRAYGEDFTPQQRLAIVLEGIQTPQEIIDICSENGISVETYNEWKSTLLSSADQIYGDPTERAVEVQEREELSVRPSTKIIGLGSDVFTEDISDLTEDKWKIHTSFKLWAAKGTEPDFFEPDVQFNDWTVMGGPAVSFSKGDHAISLSLLVPFSKWDDSHEDHETTASTAIVDGEGKQDYYLGDFRYHTSVNENLSWFMGYKVGYVSYEDQTFLQNGTLVNDAEGSTWAHGPLLGTNISIPIETSGLPLSIWGSIAYGPLIIVHDEEDKAIGVPGSVVETSTSTTSFDSWYVNPEVGIRTNITENSSLNLSYRSDIWGDYYDGPGVMVGGPSLTYSLKW